MKANNFRSVCYGMAAVMTGVAAIYNSGIVDDVISKGKQIFKKKETKQKVNEVNVDWKNEYWKQVYYNGKLDNDVLNQAMHNVYYGECFNKNNDKSVN